MLFMFPTNLFVIVLSISTNCFVRVLSISTVFEGGVNAGYSRVSDSGNIKKAMRLLFLFITFYDTFFTK